MYPDRNNEVKVKVAARQQTLSDDIALLGGALLLVVLSVVLIGRTAGGM